MNIALSSQSAGGGLSGNAVAAASGGNGINPGSTALAGAAAAGDATTAAYFAYADVSAADTGNVPVLALALTATAIYETVEFFLDIFSGSSNPRIPRQLRHQRHPLYADIIGLPDGLTPDEMPAGAPEICDGAKHPCANARPLRTKQKSQACQQATDELKQCLAVFEAAPDIPESVAIYVCEVDPEEVGRLAACTGALVMEIPKKIGEGKCLYDFYQACK